MANELLGTVDAHTSTTERAARVNLRENLKVEPETVANEQNESRKALAIPTSEHAE